MIARTPLTAKTRLTSKGQVVIPKAVRDRLRWRPGTVLRVEAGDKGVRLAAEPQDVDALLDQLHELFKDGPDMLAALEEDKRWEREYDEKKQRRIEKWLRRPRRGKSRRGR